MSSVEVMWKDLVELLGYKGDSSDVRFIAVLRDKSNSKNFTRIGFRMWNRDEIVKHVEKRYEEVMQDLLSFWFKRAEDVDRNSLVRLTDEVKNAYKELVYDYKDFREEEGKIRYREFRGKPLEIVREMIIEFEDYLSELGLDVDVPFDINDEVLYVEIYVTRVSENMITLIVEVNKRVVVSKYYKGVTIDVDYLMKKLFKTKERYVRDISRHVIGVTIDTPNCGSKRLSFYNHE